MQDDSFGRKLQSFFRENRDNPDLRVVRSNPAAEDAFALPEAQPSTREARVVEGAELAVKPVQGSNQDTSGFCFFLDGIQDSRLAFYWDGVPVVWGFAAACIRRRRPDRYMSALDGYTQSRQTLIFPYQLLSQSLFVPVGLDTVDSGQVLAGNEEERRQFESELDNPAFIRQTARRRLDRLREDLEVSLYEMWLTHPPGDGWLLLDGGIPGRLASGPGSNRVAGVIKSHQTRYFRGEDARLVMSLPVGSRTSVFKTFRKGTLQAVYSWYLRLRSADGQDPTFGLVRIEVPENPDTLSMADTISGWILAERSPVSLPDSRWDRMLYPIRDCEQYLRSISPSKYEREARLVTG